MSSLMPFMLETALVKKGADFVAGAPFTENVQISERIYTGQNPASVGKLVEEIVKKMKEMKFLWTACDEGKHDKLYIVD